MNTPAAAVLMVLITPIGVAAEPRVLGDLELDGVTAAGVFVDVNSVAAAFGDRTLTLTDSNTVAVAGKWFDLGLGLTLGRAFACCGEAADVEVASTVVGVGDIVHRGARAFKRDDGNSARGLSAGFVVAVSFKELPPSHKLRPGPPR